MAIVVALQALYVGDSVFAEEAILTTMDITTVRPACGMGAGASGRAGVVRCGVST